MAKLSAAVTALFIVATGEAFTALPRRSSGPGAFAPASSRRQATRLGVTAEESAQALSDYMAKSHEEKLRAIQDVEQKKNSEIQALKKEIEELKSSGGTTNVQTSIAPVPVAGSNEELAAKLASYQQFMAEYIVNAQEQKLLAVKAAEKAAELKYQTKLDQLLLGGSAATAAPTSQPVIAATAETKRYLDRNAKVTAAAKAGKSRWGDMEVERIGGVVAPAPAVVASPAAPAPVPAVLGEVPPEVIAADHGLRADGGVGGLTLAERVALASSAPSNGVAAPSTLAPSGAAAAPRTTVLYNLRNAKVSAAGKAGKSRWGDMEVAKATELASLALKAGTAAPAEQTLSASAEVQAADHGLRADGGVGGPSLADRVNFGAKVVAAG